MKKTLILLLVFAILGGGTWWYLNNSSKNTSLRGNDRDFGVKNTDLIHKIFIADRSGETTTLERKQGYWLYNGQYKARPNAMENLLDVIRRVDVNYVVAKAAMENIIRDLATHGIKVEIYNRENKKIKSYYVGGVTNDELGTYMIMEDAEEPYVTHIPSWEGGLRARYLLKGNEWRDRAVFAEPIETIESVTVEYPKQKSKSFKLERKGDSYELKPFYEITPVITRPVKAGAVEAFLLGFENLQSEAFQNGHEHRDSISQLLPFVNVSLTNSDGETVATNFHPILHFDAQGNMVTDADVAGSNTAVERYHVNVSNGDFVMVQHRLFQRIFWGYDSFFEGG